MKTPLTLAAALSLSAPATASLACSLDQSDVYAASISAAVVELVTLNDANLGDAMAIIRDGAVAEYHAGPDAPGCTRQIETLRVLKALSQDLRAQKAAAL